MSEKARKWKELRTRSGVTIRGLARAIGWGHTRVQYYEDVVKTPYLPHECVELIAPHVIGRGSPPVEASEVYALAGMTPPSRLLASESLQEEAVEPSTVSSVVDSVPRIPPRSEMERDVPVLGMSVGGSAGEFTMNGDAVDYVLRPPALAHRRDVFALWVEGDSMTPWRKPREPIFVERNRRPSVGDHVVIELVPSSPGEPKPAYVKKLVRQSASKVTVEQYNPRKTFEYDARRVHRLYRVMEWSEVLGYSM